MLRIKLLPFVAVLLIAGCSPSENESAPSPSETIEIAESAYAIPEKPYKSILDYGLFEDTKGQTPAQGVFTYTPINENFADYATVRRFIKLPPGTQIAYHETEPFTFPVNTVIAQSFSFLNDRRDPSQGEELIETRILIRRDWDGWEAVPYVWNDDKSDARRSVAGAIKDVSWIHDDGSTRGIRYLVPNTNQCTRCHENNEGYIVQIGTTARNLNQTVHDSDRNQLARWIDDGILAGAPDSPNAMPQLAQWNDSDSGSIRARARAYLDTNCSYCHNPNGHGSTSGLDLQFHQENPIKFGVYKPPVAAGRGSDGLSYSIDPGHPDKSFLIQRLLSTDPAIMMPPVGRRTHDAEAVTLIQAWIAEMSFTEKEAAQLIVEQKEAYEQYVAEGVFEEERDEEEDDE